MTGPRQDSVGHWFSTQDERRAGPEVPLLCAGLRTQEEIAPARADWEDRTRFGEVAAYKGSRLNAPSLVRFARPNPVS